MESQCRALSVCAPPVVRIARLLLASLTGEIIGSLLARGETDVDIGALAMGRFKS
jgi:hypothetical protein